MRRRLRMGTARARAAVESWTDSYYDPPDDREPEGEPEEREPEDEFMPEEYR